MMEASESCRNHTKRVFKEIVDSVEAGHDDNDESEKRKHRSSKSRKHGDVGETDIPENVKRINMNNNEAHQRSGSMDEDDYDARREPQSKNKRIELEERDDRRSSAGFKDQNMDGSHKSRDDENERITTTKHPDPETYRNKAGNKAEISHDSEYEKMQDKDLDYSARQEGTKDKGLGDGGQEHNLQRRRWDEADTERITVENNYKGDTDTRSVKAFDNSNDGASRDREVDTRHESGDAKNRNFDTDKGLKFTNREERKAEGDSRIRYHGRLEVQEDSSTQVPFSHDGWPESIRDDKQRNTMDKSPGLRGHTESNSQRQDSRSSRDKADKQRQDRDSTFVSRDEGEDQEGSFQLDDEGHARHREKSKKEEVHHRSRTPERTGRHFREYDDRGITGSDVDEGVISRGKERDEAYSEDRYSKGKEGNFDDKHREREGPKDYWRRSQPRHDAKDGEKEINLSREWDAQRREQDHMDREKLYGRQSYRKDNRNRSEGARNEHTDSIEIRPNKNLDFGRDETVATFPGKRSDIASGQDFSTGVTGDEWGYLQENNSKTSFSCGDAFQERFQDDDNSGRTSDFQVGKGMDIGEAATQAGPGQSTCVSMQPPFDSNQGLGPLNRVPQQASKGGRPARAARGRMQGRDAQRMGMPLPMLGAPFVPLSLPPGTMQPVGPNMPQTPGPPIPPGVFLPPFASPLVWPARAMDMNMLPLTPNVPSIPPLGHAIPRFPTNGLGMYFNQPGAGRGIPTNVLDPGLNAGGPAGRGVSHDKTTLGWGIQRTSTSGKSQSRGEQNDYSQNFVDTGSRPQNFIRELEITNVVEDYPKLRELIQRKDEIVVKSASPPMYYKCDLKDHVLSAEFYGTKFDVVLVDPPWEEYAHRAPGGEHIDCWTLEEIQNLKIEAVADTPSFIFLWVGDGVGLEQGRQCLKKWGFRRCEDICWVKTNKKNTASGLRHDSNTLLQHSKEHCLMGIKGTVRRSTDGHVIHANIDTDIIIAEEPADGSTKKPEDMYRIVEHFALGRRRLELFGEDHNIRPGWLTVGKGLSSSNFNAEAYVRNFADKDGKVWEGGGGRNPPPEAPHLVLTTPEIESLRPRSPPPKNQQQQQQQPQPILSGSNSGKNPTGSFSGPGQDAFGFELATPPPWGSSPVVAMRGPDSGHGIHGDDKISDGFRY